MESVASMGPSSCNVSKYLEPQSGENYKLSEHLKGLDSTHLLGSQKFISSPISIKLSEEEEIPKDLKEKFIISRSAFLNEFCQHLDCDLSQIYQAFNIPIDPLPEIENIEIVNTNGDYHNGIKQPLFVTIKIKNQDNPLKLVYKPRDVLMDNEICDKKSLFSQLGLPTRIILPFQEHGYDSVVKGEALDNNEKFKNLSEEYLGDKTEALKEFIRQLPEKQFLENMKIFSALAHAKIEDMHHENFILDKNGLLIPIDMEFFDTASCDYSAKQFLQEIFYQKMKPKPVLPPGTLKYEYPFPEELMSKKNEINKNLTKFQLTLPEKSRYMILTTQEYNKNRAIYEHAPDKDLFVREDIEKQLARVACKTDYSFDTEKCKSSEKSNIVDTCINYFNFLKKDFDDLYEKKWEKRDIDNELKNIEESFYARLSIFYKKVLPKRLVKLTSR